jgi:hypothetical protein
VLFIAGKPGESGGDERDDEPTRKDRTR